MIDLTGVGKYGGVKKCINLVRIQRIEPDNYTSTRFSVIVLGGYSHDFQARNENERTSWIDCICDLCGIGEFFFFVLFLKAGCKKFNNSRGCQKEKSSKQVCYCS